MPEAFNRKLLPAIPEWCFREKYEVKVWCSMERHEIHIVLSMALNQLYKVSIFRPLPEGGPF